MEYCRRVATGRGTERASKQCRWTYLAGQAPDPVLRSEAHNRHTYGSCDGQRRLFGPTHHLFPTGGTRHGAPFLRLAGSQVGVGGGDESRLATVPPDSARRQLSWPTGRAKRKMHLGGVVARREVDVFRRRG